MKVRTPNFSSPPELATGALSGGLVLDSKQESSMDIKDILVQIDSSNGNEARLNLAIELARRHGANLIGLCVFDIGLLPSAGFRIFDPEDCLTILQFQEQLRDDGLAIAAKLEEDFNERLRREAIRGEWRLVEGEAVTIVGLHARYVDLAVLGQQDPDDTRVSGWTTVLEVALLTSGRPILVVPYAGNLSDVGRRVLIGWDGGREAARAVHDALPLLSKAEVVTVLAIDPRYGNDDYGNEPGADISRHLARHGVPVTAKKTSSEGLDAADILLNYASDLGCDLIVIGGYGHSRMREIVLGGVTRGLLQHATVPVLMSH
jgi:nucleotide-binding universal stress UspA family protein